MPSVMRSTTLFADGVIQPMKCFGAANRSRGVRQGRAWQPAALQ